MTSFFFGVTMTLGGAIALMIVSYQRGWLKAVSQRFLDSEQNRSRQRMERRLVQGRNLRQELLKIVENLEDLDSVKADLARLPHAETLGRAGELVAMADELEQLARSLKNSCIQIAKRVTPEGAAINRTYKEEAFQSTETATTSTTKRKFKDSEWYRLWNPKDMNGDWKEVSGAQLNALLDQGYVDGVDFFVTSADSLE